METATDLVWEYVTSPSGNLGKVTGPLGTVASGSETLAEGVSTVLEADRHREGNVYEHSGGAMGRPAPAKPAPEPPRPAPADEPPPRPMTEEELRVQREVDDVLENIRIKQQFEDAGNAGWDDWKNWR